RCPGRPRLLPSALERGEIFPPKKAHQPAVRRSDRTIWQVVGRHELGYLIDRHIGAKSAGTRPHDPVHSLLVVLSELRGPEETQHDALVVHDPTGVPSGRPRPCTTRGQRLLESAGGDISASHVSRSRTRGVRPFGRKPCRQPVELSGYVVVHVLEPEALEPPRGSWAQISGRVPTVDEYGPARIELCLGFGFEASERETDRSRKMVSLELFPGQHLHHLRAFPHETADVVAIDLLRHRSSQVGEYADMTIRGES